AMRGNIVDMAVGIIIGASFGKIITSLVNDVLMPPIGLAIGRVDFSQLHIVLQKAQPAVMEGEKIIKPALAQVSMNYGPFIQTIIDFIIVAFCVFLLIKAMNKLMAKKEAAPAAPPAPSEEVTILKEIRDALKK
ncbi:MAG TPA: large-conductance mechanosensitive channel protein MscL, partial [Bacteroidales bacterium]|nr:large-conductance mechanosensitive channel protein MscL [Bacteroidales bacterium]